MTVETQAGTTRAFTADDGLRNNRLGRFLNEENTRDSLLRINGHAKKKDWRPETIRLLNTVIVDGVNK